MAKSISGGVANQSNVPTLNAGYGRNDGWFDITLGDTVDRIVVNSGTVEEVIDGWVSSSEVSGEVASDQPITIRIFDRSQWDNIEPTAEVISGPATLENNILKPTASGDVALRLTGSNGVVRDYTITVVYQSSAIISTNARQSRVAGILGTHCESVIGDRIVGATTSMLPIFSGYTASLSSGIYTRNTACWAYGLDLTCISPWNSKSGRYRAGTLITPRHIINSAHYELDVGNIVKFVMNDNTVVSRTITGKKRHPDYSPYYPDLTVYTLDSDVPSGIGFSKVLPSDYVDYIPDVYGIAALCLDQEEKAIISDLDGWVDYVGFTVPDSVDEQVLYENKVSGDSGNPAFLVINEELVLLTCWTYGGWGVGTFVTPLIDDLNQMIIDADTQAGVSTGYTLTEIDLSGFPNFTTQNYIIEDNDIVNGNASLWVESGTVNEKESYIMRESLTDYWTLAWDGDSWEFTATGSPTSSFSDTANDGVTPDVATFSTLNFSTPS